MFGVKRAHLSALKFGHGELARFNLTPARFDLLYSFAGSGLIMQRELRQLLGVARSTISRMLRSLEQLGFVTRGERGYSRYVMLTPLGRDAIWRATRRMIGRRIARRAVDGAFGRGTSLRFRQRDTLEGLLRLVRRRFGDIARLYYAWGHPDD